MAVVSTEDLWSLLGRFTFKPAHGDSVHGGLLDREKHLQLLHSLLATYLSSSSVSLHIHTHMAPDFP